MPKRVSMRMIAGCGAALLVSVAAGGLIGGFDLSSQPMQIQGWQPVDQATATVLSTPVRAGIAPTQTRPRPTARPTQTPAPTAEVAPVAEPSVVATDQAIITYTVQRGDLLYALARRFGTTEDAIVALNPGINPQSLSVGATLRIPAR